MAPSFTITAPPSTDIWRKPPSTDRFNAPTSSETDSVTVGGLTKFLGATISFNIKAKEQYEQAGLLLSFLPTSSGASSGTSSPPKWIKAGIEQYEGVPRVGVVATDNWSDWSIAPSAEDGEWTTLSIERGKDDMGYSLWVYQVTQGGKEKLPLREINWVFGIGEEWEIKVEAYACKPGEGEPLTVEFKDFSVSWS